MLVLQTIFWICFISLLHTYVLYPLVLQLLSFFSTNASLPNHNQHTQKSVSILIAAYNEEKVIQQKLESIYNSQYPADKIQVIVGSDASTDRTNQIVRSFPNAELVEFPGRSGKVRIINHLATLAQNEILILTDANVIFDKNTIQELEKNFNDSKVALVDSNMVNINQVNGISKAEGTYIRGEVGIKNNEGKVFGMMMGPFGGCYAVKKSYFEPVPENFLVDDFYINMKVLEKGGKSISEKNAKAFEEVPTDWRIEFKRKIRIATGSFQNLYKFHHLLLRFNTLSFCFLSHKVLRWKGPFLMIGLYSSNLLLAWWFYSGESLFGHPSHLHLFEIVFLLLNVLPLLFIFDLFISLFGIRFTPTRLVSHFFTTNLALFIGFFKFLGGVRSSIWTPTKR